MAHEYVQTDARSRDNGVSAHERCHKCGVERDVVRIYGEPTRYYGPQYAGMAAKLGVLETVSVPYTSPNGITYPVDVDNPILVERARGCATE